MGCGCNSTPCNCGSSEHGQGERFPDFPGGGPCGCRKSPCECAAGQAQAAAVQPGNCNCGQNPCACRRCTRCDLYVQGTPNVWVERGEVSADLFQAGTPDYSRVGICSLDTLTDAQIINIIERDEKARQDLLKVTSDPHLRKLALTVPRLPTQELVDAEQLNQNRPNEPSSIPFYAVFRGQPPFPQ